MEYSDGRKPFDVSMSPCHILIVIITLGRSGRGNLYSGRQCELRALISYTSLLKQHGCLITIFVCFYYVEERRIYETRAIQFDGMEHLSSQQLHRVLQDI